jgi:arylsulfatase A-like enzyme
MRIGRSSQVGLSLAVLVLLAGPLVRAQGRPASPGARPPNVLIVTFDTTRPDRLGAYGYRAARTPAIDRLAREGTLMQRAYSPSVQTLPSHASLFTGLYSITHGVLSNGQTLSDEAVTLAEVLSSQGYATGAIVGAATLLSDFGLDQGFDRYDEEFDGSVIQRSLKSFVRLLSRSRLNIPSTRAAPEVTRRAVNWLNRHAQRKRPFFLWLHYWDPHEPYEFHPDFERPELVVSGGELNAYGQKEANYVNEIEFADHYLGKVLSQLDRLGLSKNTLVVFTSDHGESLGAHEYVGHRREVYEDIIRIPMIFRLPGRVAAGDVVAAPVTSIDVMPTVLDLLGVPYLAESYQGENIFTLGKKERPVFALAVELFTRSPIRRSVIDQGLKFIEFDEDGRDVLYDLDADPDETRNLLYADGRPMAEAAEWRGQIVRWYQAFTSITLEDIEISPEQLERLRSLGYVK